MLEVASDSLVPNTKGVLFRVSRRLGISAFEVELAYSCSHSGPLGKEFKIGLKIFSSCIQHTPRLRLQSTADISGECSSKRDVSHCLSCSARNLEHLRRTLQLVQQLHA
jgi:hypothetical protein